MNINKKKRIGIVNYSTGNIGSVWSALNFYGYDTVLIDKAECLKSVDLIVLVGVGSFQTAVLSLNKQKLWDALNREVIAKKKPVLGICLGMQLFADVSYEGGETPGFGWIKGKVVRLKGDNLRVPHIGWDEVKYGNRDKLFKGIRYGFFYYMHSYHFIPDDSSVVIAHTDYGNTAIVSAVKKNNIVGVQFHPEKSQGDGLRCLRNIIEDLL